MNAAPNVQTWTISIFRPFFSKNAGRIVPGCRPETRAMSWALLGRSLTTARAPSASGKTELPAWSPALYRAGVTSRSLEGVVEVSCLVLDYDDGTPVDAALARWADFPLIWHTSWSHMADGRTPKFRVVLPLARPVPAALWPRAWDAARRRAAGTPDPKCKDASRIYFVPALRDEGAVFEGAVVDAGGALLDLDAERLPATAEERAAELRRLAPPPPPIASHGAARRRAENERLKTDPVAREWAANRLGARVRGNRAEDIRCPGCGRATAFSLPAPGAATGAECQHANSCGWLGWVDVLLDASAGAAVLDGAL